MAKYVMRIELVESFAKIGGGRGGYWEDQGYECTQGSKLRLYARPRELCTRPNSLMLRYYPGVPDGS